MVKKTMLVVVEFIDRKNLSSRPMMHETKALTILQLFSISFHPQQTLSCHWVLLACSTQFASGLTLKKFSFEMLKEKASKCEAPPISLFGEN
jgi:hypothetical protein